MHTRYFLFVCLTFLGLFSGCVQEAELPEYQDVQISINAKVDNEGIDLSGDLQTEGQQVIERGFILQRTYHKAGRWGNDIIQTDTFKLDNNTASFNYRSTGYMADEASCEAYAYAKLDRGIYRSSPVSFSAGGEASIQISSVEIFPKDKGAEGTIIIKGENFSYRNDLNYLTVDTCWKTPANFYPWLRESSPTELTFDYRFSQVGEFPLRLWVGDKSVRLNTFLKVNGVHLLGLKPSHPRIYEEVEVLMENAIKGVQYEYYDEDRGVVIATLKNNKIFFPLISPTINFTLSYYGYIDRIYSDILPVTFSFPWEHVGSLSMPPIKVASGNNIYATDGKQLYIYSTIKGKAETWPIEYPNDIRFFADKQYYMDLYISGDNIYICSSGFGYITEKSVYDWQILLLRFQRSKQQWETLLRLPSSYYNYTQPVIHIVQCGHLMLININNKDIAAYYLNNETWTYHHNKLHETPCWVGTYEHYFYFMKQHSNGEWQCYKINPDDHTKTYPVGPILRYDGIIDSKSVFIENDFLYVSTPPNARLPLNKNNPTWEFLGTPLSEWSELLPFNDAIYCISDGELYRFEDDRK